jgi:two-component system chemotaxis response regulator CheB
MICDDSAVIRRAITRILEADPRIRVISSVGDGRLAVETLSRQPADVLVLDIEMPVMDGLSALPLLLRTDPGIKIVMASTLTTRGADVAMRALRLGAADYVPKPSATGIAGDELFGRELVQKVLGLARLRRRAERSGTLTAARATSTPPLRPVPAASARLLAIASSTGGPQALFTLAQSLGANLPVPVVLTQHMPAAFTPILADHITRIGGAPCAEARHGETLLPGRLYLAPGNRHLLVRSAGERLQAELDDGPAENFCRPAADPMLRSAAAACGGRVLVLMLTGMGHDGLDGTRTIIEAGGAAIAQDEETSVVWGMPGATAQAGLCSAVLPLPQIGPSVRDLLRRRPA